MALHYHDLGRTIAGYIPQTRFKVFVDQLVGQLEMVGQRFVTVEQTAFLAIATRNRDMQVAPFRCVSQNAMGIARRRIGKSGR